MSIVSLIFSIICAADIITFIVLSWGGIRHASCITCVAPFGD